MLCGRTPPMQLFSSREKQSTFDFGQHQVINFAILSSTGCKIKQDFISTEKEMCKWTSLSSYRASPDPQLIGQLRVTGALQPCAGDYKITGVFSLGAYLQHPIVRLLH